ncbi:hypothetical protein Zmor_005009 [Zophobas morio]|uniref:Uncharacterized protein n=1 Tax=Zophobas morio TaxID=2755281 RepID=A0AA38IVB3_9CUCU|nr:hypothetical protein Zmor_005009 [Zophobas morio]
MSRSEYSFLDKILALKKNLNNCNAHSGICKKRVKVMLKKEIRQGTRIEHLLDHSEEFSLQREIVASVRDLTGPDLIILEEFSLQGDRCRIRDLERPDLTGLDLT